MHKAPIEPPISYFKPIYLLQAERDYATKAILLEQLHHAQDKAIIQLIDQQRKSGLEIITDGAYRNLYQLRDFWLALQGVTPTMVTSGHVYQDQNSGEMIPRVTNRIDYNPSHNILNNFSFLQGETGDGLIARIDIPAPSQFLVELVRNGWYDRAVYPSVDALVSDIASAYNATLHALYERGCRRIMLIDPCWGRLCDHYASKRLLQGGIDIVKLPGLMRMANESAIYDLPIDMHVILYAQVETPILDHCWDVVAEVLAHNRVDSFMFDWQDNDHSLISFIGQVAPGKEVIIGIGDTTEPQLDDTEKIKLIIGKVTKANPNISVRISTKGGFVNNTDSIDFSTITEVDQWRKIKNLTFTFT